MKNPKLEAKVYLEKLDKWIDALVKADADLATARSDGAALEQEIAAAGDLDYRDSTKINGLATARAKLDLCSKAITRLEEKLEAAIEWRQPIIKEGGHMANRALQDIMARRMETVTISLLPFSADRASAAALASKSDICLAAWRSSIYYSQIETSLASQKNPKAILEVVSNIRDVLTESIKADPNLMRFLAGSFQPATTAAAVSAAENT